MPIFLSAKTAERCGYWLRLKETVITQSIYRHPHSEEQRIRNLLQHVASVLQKDLISKALIFAAFHGCSAVSGRPSCTNALARRASAIMRTRDVQQAAAAAAASSKQQQQQAAASSSSSKQRRQQRQQRRQRGRRN
jgi:hypothetical protein